MIVGRPAADEAAPFYHTYINKIQEPNILEALAVNGQDTTDWLASFPEDKWEYRYAEGKWTPKEVLIHLIDSERIFAYRALRIARNDDTPLAGFNQDDYVPVSNANHRSPDSLIGEYMAVRGATLQLLQHLDAPAWDRKGTASGFPVSVRGLAYIIAGHEQHHLQILNERYL